MFFSGFPLLLLGNFALGAWGELLYSLPMTLSTLGCAGLLASRRILPPAARVAAALSVFLFVPRACLNTRPEAFDRVMRIRLEEHTATMQWIPAYAENALRFPLTDPAFHAKRLDSLRNGWINPQRHHDTPENRMGCRMHFIAWAYELGYDAPARTALFDLFCEDPNLLIPLWHPGMCLTHDHRDVAYRKIREQSRRIIEHNLAQLADGPEVEMLKRAKAILEEISAALP